jgi:hypothetical protein
LAAESSASAIAKKAYHYIGSLDKYAFDAVVTNDDTKDGKSVKYTHRVSAKVDRPDKFRFDVKGDIKDRSSYLNDGVFTMVDHGFGYYGQLKTGKGIDGTLDYIFDRYGIKAPLAQLIYSDMHKRTKINKGKNFGKVMLDGTECDYIAFMVKSKEVHMWIPTGDKPLIKRFIIIDRKITGNPRSVSTIKWNPDAKISDSDFVFKAPKDASKISIQSAK